MLDLTQLDTILKTTIDTIRQGQRQMFSIAETAREEGKHLKQELENIQAEIQETIEQVDRCELKEKASRRRLARVSADFKNFSEEDIKDAYENAKNIQIELALLRAKEQRQREKRTELELRYRDLEAMIKKAEALISQVGVAMDFLSSNIENLWAEVEKVQDREETIFAVIKAQEEERRRVARYIHDGPAQSLANVVLQVEYCQKLLDVDPEKIKYELEVLKDIARSNLENIRKIIFALRPMDLDDLGLVPAVKRFISEFEKTCKISVDFKFIGGERRYASALEVAVFRIVQEALNNVAKHSGASRVEVVLETQPNAVAAVVRDNGSGFILEEVQGESSFGIRGMKERAALLKGDIHISSTPGQGTEVFVNFPVREDEFDAVDENNGCR